MSVKLMAVVWDLDLPPGEKLVLLALADQANDAGTQCWPSVATIAKRSGQGERTVRRALSDLEKAGHLTRDHRDGNSTQYRVHPCQNGSPDKLAPLPKTTKTPANLAGKPSRTIISHKTTSSESIRAREIPDGFEPVMTAKTQATVDGWPPGRLDDELEGFTAYHSAKGTKSKDWQASWRTWVINTKRWDKGNGRTNSDTGLGINARAALAAFGEI